ncbi:hypothetical protein QS306_04775 [Paraburkholderia bonniea]|uniref:hypothetical protein n=1 Tax=Paraburkholderia bonniea TaxID=2152891 RepID=UPI0025740F91|nr:hypothetical protein [Paraburkholderia bonniea]WJF90976.1 hypothetical protein QS306_04775 [Paraburkholderia bonniea]WJF94290.1 hypothetical protein QS308_04780 [Paraburkholderia bonniea]
MFRGRCQAAKAFKAWWRVGCTEYKAGVIEVVLLRKTSAQNFGAKLRRKTSAQNFGAKLRRKTSAQKRSPAIKIAGLLFCCAIC